MTTAQEAARELVEYAHLISAGTAPAPGRSLELAIHALVADWAVTSADLAKANKRLAEAVGREDEFAPTAWGESGYEYRLGLAREHTTITGYTEAQARSAVKTWPDRADLPVLVRRRRTAFHEVDTADAPPTAERPAAAEPARGKPEPTTTGRDPLKHLTALPPRFTRTVARHTGVQPNVEDWAIAKAINETVLTVEEAAVATNLQTGFMCEVLAAGTIPSQRVGHQQLVRLADVISYLEDVKSR